VRVPVTGLVGHPGETRALVRAVPRDAFGGDPWGPADEALSSAIDLDLHLDAVVEGVLVRGTVTFTLDLACARCLVVQPTDRTVSVAELFVDPARREPEDEDDPGYELVDDVTALDLSTLVRDAIVLDLPARVLCRPDCQGLCPQCGADRNSVDCGHRASADPDPRWSKLAELRLPNDPSGE
jgi:uncharacterized protein